MSPTIFSRSIALCVALLGASAAFAQGPCLLGVGNCPQSPTTSNSANVDPGNHSVDVTDSRIAAEIIAAKRDNARYLLLLQRYYDPSITQWCEERAWVGGDYAGGETHVVINVGPTVKVCFDPNKVVWTVEQVNATERAIDSWADAIFRWEQYEAEVAKYISANQANPPALAYGQSEMARCKAWTQYYRNGITTYRNAVNQFAPASN
jgi:hypothetical protein